MSHLNTFNPNRPRLFLSQNARGSRDSCGCLGTIAGTGCGCRGLALRVSFDFSRSPWWASRLWLGGVDADTGAAAACAVFNRAVSRRSFSIFAAAFFSTGTGPAPAAVEDFLATGTGACPLPISIGESPSLCLEGFCEKTGFSPDNGTEAGAAPLPMSIGESPSSRLESFCEKTGFLPDKGTAESG